MCAAVCKTKRWHRAPPPWAFEAEEGRHSMRMGRSRCLFSPSPISPSSQEMSKGAPEISEGPRGHPPSRMREWPNAHLQGKVEGRFTPCPAPCDAPRYAGAGVHAGLAGSPTSAQTGQVNHFHPGVSSALSRKGHLRPWVLRARPGESLLSLREKSKAEPVINHKL